MTGRAWWPITIGAVVLLIVAAVLAVTVEPEQPTAMAEGWTSAMVEGAQGAAMTDVIPVEEGFLAVGHRREGDRYEPALWSSKDGQSWHPVGSDALEARPAGGDDAVITALSVGDLTVAAGHEGTPSADGPVAFWVSQDEGQTWERVPHDDEVLIAGQVQDVTTAPDGSWIAVGSTETDAGRRGRVWRSPDGRIWEVLSPETTGDGDVSFNVVTTGGDGLVALGSDRGSGDGSEAPVWTSSDGTSWRQVRMPPDLLDGTATIRDAIPWRQEGMLLAADQGPSDASRITVLSRLDTDLDAGTAWKSAAVTAGGAHAAGLLETGDGHVLLVGSVTVDGDPAVRAWSTKDGQSWEPVEAPALDTSGAAPTAVATDGTITVIVGRSGEEGAVAWVHGGSD